MNINEVKAGQKVVYYMKVTRKDAPQVERVIAEVLNITARKNVRIRVGLFPKSTDVSVKPENIDLL